MQDANPAVTRPSGLPLLLLSSCAHAIATSALFTMLIPYLTRELSVSLSTVATLYGVIGVVSAVLGVGAGVLVDRVVGARAGLCGGLMLSGAATLALGMPDLVGLPIGLPAGIVLIGGLLILVGAGTALIRVSQMVLTDDLYAGGTDPEQRDAGFLLVQLCYAAGAVLTPVVTGVLGALFGLRWLYLLGGGLLLTVALVLWMNARHLPAGRPVAAGPAPLRPTGGLLIALLTALVLPQLLRRSQGTLMQLFFSTFKSAAGGALFGTLGLVLVPAVLVALAVLVFAALQRRGVPAGSLLKLGIGIAMAAAQCGAVALIVTAGVAQRTGGTAIVAGLWCAGMSADVLLGGMSSALFMRVAPVQSRATLAGIAGLLGFVLGSLLALR